MARICSFQIEYKNQSFPTLVSVNSFNREVVCTVHFVERKLRYIEPGDKLVYCTKEGLKQPQNLPQDLSKELIRCIHESLLFLTPNRA